MNHLFRKLDFIHRRLWRQNGIYRAAVLFGPAPLLGCLLTVTAWGLVQEIGRLTYQPPRWAVPHASATRSNADGRPQTLEPAMPLPPVGADGGFAGYEPGWQGTAQPMQVNPPLDVDIKPTPLTGFLLDGPTFDMAQIMAGGPKTGLYVGEGKGLLVIRTAGDYALSARFERPAGPLADCVMRLGLGPRRILSNLELAVVNDISGTPDAVRFTLQPGFYYIVWAFGCWHDHEVTGPGRLTLLISHPGEQSLLPARSDDVVRPKPARP
jgi:hypothetical protein